MEQGSFGSPKASPSATGPKVPLKTTELNVDMNAVEIASPRPPSHPKPPPHAVTVTVPPLLPPSSASTNETNLKPRPPRSRRPRRSILTQPDLASLNSGVPLQALQQIIDDANTVPLSSKLQQPEQNETKGSSSQGTVDVELKEVKLIEPPAPSMRNDSTPVTADVFASSNVSSMLKQRRRGGVIGEQPLPQDGVLSAILQWREDHARDAQSSTSSPFPLIADDVERAVGCRDKLVAACCPLAFQRPHSTLPSRLQKTDSCDSSPTTPCSTSNAGNGLQTPVSGGNTTYSPANHDKADTGCCSASVPEPSGVLFRTPYPGLANSKELLLHTHPLSLLPSRWLYAFSTTGLFALFFSAVILSYVLTLLFDVSRAYIFAPLFLLLLLCFAVELSRTERVIARLVWTRFESLYLLTQIVLFIILNAYAQSRNADAEKMADIIVSALVFFIAFIIVITLDASQMPRAFRLIGLAIGILNSVRLLFRKDITGEDIFGDMQFCPLICLSMRDTAYAALFNVVLFFLKHLIIAAFFPAYCTILAAPLQCHRWFKASRAVVSLRRSLHAEMQSDYQHQFEKHVEEHGPQCPNYPFVQLNRSSTTHSPAFSTLALHDPSAFPSSASVSSSSSMSAISAPSFMVSPSMCPSPAPTHSFPSSLSTLSSVTSKRASSLSFPSQCPSFTFQTPRTLRLFFRSLWVWLTIDDFGRLDAFDDVLSGHACSCAKPSSCPTLALSDHSSTCPSPRSSSHGQSVSPGESKTDDKNTTTLRPSPSVLAPGLGRSGTVAHASFWLSDWVKPSSFKYVVSSPLARTLTRGRSRLLLQSQHDNSHGDIEMGSGPLHSHPNDPHGSSSTHLPVHSLHSSDNELNRPSSPTSLTSPTTSLLPSPPSTLSPTPPSTYVPHAPGTRDSGKAASLEPGPMDGDDDYRVTRLSSNNHRDTGDISDDVSASAGESDADEEEEEEDGDGAEEEDPLHAMLGLDKETSLEIASTDLDMAEALAAKDPRFTDILRLRIDYSIFPPQFRSKALGQTPDYFKPVALQPLNTNKALTRWANTRFHMIFFCLGAVFGVVEPFLFKTNAVSRGFACFILLALATVESTRIDVNMLHRLFRSFEFWFLALNVCLHAVTGVWGRLQYVYAQSAFTDRGIPNDVLCVIFTFIMFLVTYGFSLWLDVFHRPTALRVLATLVQTAATLAFMVRESLFTSYYTEDYEVCHIWCSTLYQIVVASYTTVGIFVAKGLISALFFPHSFTILRVNVKREFLYPSAHSRLTRAGSL